MMKIKTVTSTWARLVVEALQDYGLNIAELCLKANIELNDLENPYARIPQDDITRLWIEAEKVSGNPAIGLVMANRLSLRQLSTAVYCFIGSDSLKRAFMHIKDFQHILSQSIDIDIYESNEGFFVEFSHYGNDLFSVPQTTDAAFASCMVMLEWVCEDPVKPLRVELTHTEKGHRLDYDRVFGCPVKFNANRNRLLFSKDDFERALPTANERMASSHVMVLAEQLHKIKASDLSTQVRDLIARNICSGNATTEKIASILCMTKRTFQRRLKEEGWTFKELLDDVRKKMAKDYLCKDQLAVTTISAKLGFAEQTVFMRAFKRWYNESPVRYRRNYSLKELPLQTIS